MCVYSYLYLLGSPIAPCLYATTAKLWATAKIELPWDKARGEDPTASSGGGGIEQGGNQGGVHPASSLAEVGTLVARQLQAHRHQRQEGGQDLR